MFETTIPNSFILIVSYYVLIYLGGSLIGSFIVLCYSMQVLIDKSNYYNNCSYNSVKGCMTTIGKTLISLIYKVCA